MRELDRAKQILKDGGYTCVLIKGDELLTCTERGVAPIIELHKSGKALRGYTVADKVVGKAVALLLALVGAREIYATTMSKSAIPVLSAFGIEYSYSSLTDRIINRDGTDMCPMEKTVEQIDDPEKAYIAICATFEKMRKT